MQRDGNDVDAKRLQSDFRKVMRVLEKTQATDKTKRIGKREFKKRKHSPRECSAEAAWTVGRGWCF